MEEGRMTAAARTGAKTRPAPFGLFGDERLAQRVGAGDERAFTVVYERYHQMLYRYCRSILHNDADAQDALQSAFTAAFAALRAGQRDAPMRPWLFRIAHNESVSVLRRRRPACELAEASDHGTASIEDLIAQRAELSVLLRDLRDLTDRQRSALVLRELSGLSHQEIAITLGTTVGAAKQTIFEARRSLFEFAEGRAMGCDEIRRTISDADGRVLRGRRVRAHLRECSSCAAFAAAIPARTGELRAFAPTLPTAAAAGLFGRTALAAAGRGGGAGLGPVAAGAAAKTAVVGAGFGANALAGMAVVASATAGVTVGVDKLAQAMAHRTAAGRPPMTAPAPARNPASAVAAPGGREVRSGGGLAHAAARANTSGARVRRTAGSTSHTSWAGSPTPGFAGQSGTDTSTAPGSSQAAYYGANQPGYAWRGEPARWQSGQSAEAGSSTATHDGSPGSAKATGRPARTGRGRSSWAASASSRPNGSERSASEGSGVQPGNGRLTVNAPAAVASGVGAVASGVSAVAKGAGAVASGVGAAAGSATGTVTSTVSGILPAATGSAQSSAPTLPPLSLPGAVTGLLRGHRVMS
jgi:RNA polymerase sigma factor (sigma-70 family)